MRNQKNRKIRKGNNVVALMCKRKKFSTIFLHTGLLVWMIVVLAYVLGLNFFVTNKKSDAMSNYYKAQMTMVRFISSLSEQCAEPEFSNNVQFQMAMMAVSRGFFSLLQERESGEVIADCSERIFQLKSATEETDAMVYICVPTEIFGWEKYREELQRHNKGLVHLYETISFSGFYTDGNYFVPDGMQIKTTYIKDLEYYLARNHYQIYELMNTYIEAPVKESLPQSYKKVVVDETGGAWMSPIVAGYHENSPRKNYMCSSDASYESLIELQEFLKYQTPKVSGSDGMAEHFFSIELTSMMGMTLKDGREVAFLSAMVYDVWEQYAGWMIAIAVAMLLLGSLLAYLLAKASYARLKAQYDVEDYRRNLMNTMAHDLKSPLMSISGYAENLRDNLYTEKQEYYSEAILKNVQYMNGIIESVLNFSKSESGNVMLKRESLDILEMLNELLGKLETKVQENGLTIVCEGKLRLDADKVLFEQALYNLVDNAMKYASKNSTIHVMIDARQISFQNFCETDLRAVAGELCDPFVVGEASRGQQKGNGLGLAITRNICQLHGFELQVICKERSFEAKILI